MDTYTVKKKRLLKKLIKNRDAHRAEFLQAQGKFRERVVEHLDRHLQDARDGKKIRLYVSLPEPEDHTDDYQAAIDGLDWEIAEEVELDYRQFNQLVRNRWAWRESFASNTQAYTTGKWS